MLFRSVAAGVSAAGVPVAVAAPLAVAVPEGAPWAGEDAQINCAPNALVLFNPILDTSKKGFGFDRFPSPELAKQANLMGAIRKDLPPMIIFHGTTDRVVPIESSEVFTKKMTRKKNAITLLPYEGQGHGFFNLNVSFDFYQSTLNAISREVWSVARLIALNNL